MRAGITHIEIKSGYALDVAGERRLCELAAELTDDVTFLGRTLVPAEYERGPTTTWRSCAARCSRRARPHARWIDVFCERGAFDAEQSRAVLEAGRERGLGLRVHANQLGLGPGVQLAVELGPRRPTTARISPTADVEALAGLGDRRDACCRRPTSRRAARTPTRGRLLDAGATVRARDNCNPGSSYTTSMSFCIALAVREMGMTAEEALRAATLGGRRGAPARRCRLPAGRRAATPGAGGTLLTHLVYRAGRAADRGDGRGRRGGVGHLELGA